MVLKLLPALGGARAVGVGWCWSCIRRSVLELSPSGRCLSCRRWVVLEQLASVGAGAVAVGLVLELSPLVWLWSFRRRSVLELSASGGAGAVAVGPVL